MGIAGVSSFLEKRTSEKKVQDLRGWEAQSRFSALDEKVPGASEKLSKVLRNNLELESDGEDQK